VARKKRERREKITRPSKLGARRCGGRRNPRPRHILRAWGTRRGGKKEEEEKRREKESGWMGDGRPHPSKG
jgi:hypothetical protein